MLFHDLIAHKGYADAELLNAVQQHHAASADAQLRTLLHHMLVSNRFWLLAIIGEPFVAEVETRVAQTFAPLVASFRATHERETTWLAGATDAALSRPLESALIPGGRCLVSDALLQVCLHSQGHRAQCAKMLRALGGTPPATDFILWRIDRRTPAWPRD
jgi:uncharacterized damage-inducible protein DinB